MSGSGGMKDVMVVDVDNMLCFPFLCCVLETEELYPPGSKRGLTLG